ncbi:MAG: Holliday junction resolvase Hjc [Thermoprotei archaeon]
MSVKSRASSLERYVLSRLRDKGFAVMRAPSSGSKRKDPVPDLVAMKDGVILLIEVKSKQEEGTIYVKKEQAEGILEFARRSGGEPFLCVRFPHETRFVEFSKLRKTQGGNYAVDVEVAKQGMTLDELVRYVESKRSRTLDNFIR